MGSIRDWVKCGLENRKASTTGEASRERMERGGRVDGPQGASLHEEMTGQWLWVRSPQGVVGRVLSEPGPGPEATGRDLLGKDTLLYTPGSHVHTHRYTLTPTTNTQTLRHMYTLTHSHNHKYIFICTLPHTPQHTLHTTHYTHIPCTNGPSTYSHTHIRHKYLHLP